MWGIGLQPAAAAMMALSADKSHPGEAAIILVLKASISDKLHAKSTKKLPNNNKHY